MPARQIMPDTYAIETLEIERYKIIERMRKHEDAPTDERVETFSSTAESKKLRSLETALKILRGGRTKR